VKVIELNMSHCTQLELHDPTYFNTPLFPLKLLFLPKMSCFKHSLWSSLFLFCSCWPY